MRHASLLALTLVGLACGGTRVGDEDYFAGAPLPEPEEEDTARPASSASAAGPIEPPKPPSCDHPPAKGFERCDKERSNVPCIYGDIGGCLVRCEKCDGKENCTERAPMPFECPKATAL